MGRQVFSWMWLALALAVSSPVAAQTNLDRAKAFAAFIGPAYPLFLARAGTWETDQQKLAGLAERAAVGIAAAAPADCNAERFRTNLCGLQVFLQPSSSMEPTLLEGELIVRKRYAVDEKPRRGDIIVFETVPGYSDKPTTYVKRLIGLPGETVELRDGVVFVDGKALPQSPTNATFRGILTGEIAVMQETSPDGRRYRIGMSGTPPSDEMDNAGPFDVPEGHYFVLGDNRHNSADSRFPEQMGENGFVPAKDVSGRIVTIMVSKDQPRVGLVVD